MSSFSYVQVIHRVQAFDHYVLSPYTQIRINSKGLLYSVLLLFASVAATVSRCIFQFLYIHFVLQVHITGSYPPPPPPHTHTHSLSPVASRSTYARSPSFEPPYLGKRIYHLSRELVTIVFYINTRVFSGNLPEISAKMYPFPNFVKTATGLFMCSGGGGGGGSYKGMPTCGRSINK